MNIRHAITGFAALAITVSAGVSADEIYKWTDEEGNIHYEDRPSGAATEERLQFSYNRTDSASVQQRVEGQRDMVAARQKAREEADEKEQSRAEERAAAEQKLADCERYRSQLKTMLESRRLYREDDAGERVYLDEEEKNKARQQAEDLIKNNCSS
jgi:hypothetical protein